MESCSPNWSDNGLIACPWSRVLTIFKWGSIHSHHSSSKIGLRREQTQIEQLNSNQLSNNTHLNANIKILPTMASDSSTNMVSSILFSLINYTNVCEPAPGTITWVEIPATDLTRVQTFYNTVSDDYLPNFLCPPEILIFKSCTPKVYRGLLVVTYAQQKYADSPGSRSSVGTPLTPKPCLTKESSSFPTVAATAVSSKSLLRTSWVLLCFPTIRTRPVLRFVLHCR
jgi:hypothetical protein